MTINDLAFTFLLLSLALALGRLMKGPDLPDRVVALDLIAMIFAGLVAAFCIRMAEPIYLDALLVLAGVVFFGTAAFARYLETIAREDEDE